MNNLIYIKLLSTAMFEPISKRIKKSAENNLRNIKILGLTISFLNIRELLEIFKDIFILKEYDFVSRKANPKIIDCGSHIGLGVLFFKKIYPKAEITAIEPNPKNFRILSQNISQNNLKKIKLVNAAVTRAGSRVIFYRSKQATNVFAREMNLWSWGDFVKGAMNKNLINYEALEVPSLRLSSLITKQIDFLKIDIEGSESEVLSEIKDKLYLVKKLVIEFHNETKEDFKKLKKILEILDKESFNFYLMQKKKILDENLVQETLPPRLLIKATNSILLN
ncbi:hypothetical protein A2962_03185 [Candidatus Woesebacteria bacterium RIFCSPLOWO2_01_FULL_39_61]|uniref:Methyltransferase FkbM domain-containing protein n=1 Tax=Candidatus Woesebacteria bacterium RIFCSPHIGHO2_02_FULL_39_13 TaxID=1802505 RepID=A0A1F7Z2Q7_9BACT|nr:MAG: hypothetical protein A2692_04270 [Candidatus Woesebacteria bacterium RIFCSPHIGHO2_01_FULL_39_95]OGM33827.1 MAG: hypothetical protein A3D01_02555 [Candidatus Woesebacteria bacterium RIFCSPHIGHO2_02_FULL_39_13]OGM38988.1 MAG: hypothetical protein A3E13_04825 [Candidatus Woesebacteria bacterium RIFCSPHIGHO2_12_FULL_40_20]OGM67493.1 MAG: hypothetical protein A2962_03185 [Candidatus Woesebacteria bacterium RIFCSPLOWO2_01_FULL_39_61]OGM72824.1 MAG: hypothetical protein A3H19_05690 [Candidatus